MLSFLHPIGSDMAKAGVYPLNTRKFFKIWFSTNPNSFMGILNQMSLVGMNAANKEAVISLIYSKKLLKAHEVKKLENFAKKQNPCIQLVDLNEIRPLIKNPNDQEMFDRCVEELDHLGKGGNPAAASDCLRTLIPVLEKYGIYVDCDLHVNFSTLSPRYRLTGPILLESRVLPFIALPINKNASTIEINNELFGVATNPKTGKIHLDALPIVRAIQEQIAKNYNTHPTDLMLSIPEIKESPIWVRMLEHFRKQYPKANIIKFRHFVTQLTFIEYIKMLFTPEQVALVKSDILKDQQTRRTWEERNDVLKKILLSKSVIHLTGPMAWYEAIRAAKKP